MNEEKKIIKARRKRKRMISMMIITIVMLASIGVLCYVAHKASYQSEIILNGEETVSIPWYGEYKEDGASAYSYYKLFGRGEKEIPVDISGNPDPKHPGDYTITYTAKDGDKVLEAKRTVTVQPMSDEQRAALIAIRDAFTKKTVDDYPEDQKIIFLTFDDGPGAYTERLLGILDKYDVKATFFVTQNFPDYKNMIGEEARRGHTVAVHTKSHQPKQVYTSEEAFWSDIEAMNDIIEEQTGERSKFMRFLGGGSNTISKYNPGIMTKLTQSVEAHGYQYFDWNVSSGDSDGTKTAEGCLQNLKSELGERRVSVVLCHDIKEYLVDCMEDFIPWALDNGYVFMPIYDGAPTAHHKVFN